MQDLEAMPCLSTCHQPLLPKLMCVCQSGNGLWPPILVHLLSPWVHCGTSGSVKGATATRTSAEVSVLVFLPFSFPAPSAPVINPQAPNSATGSSVRVCWSLYSDDTVESYELSCRPVRDSSPGKNQAGEHPPGAQSCSEVAAALGGLGAAFLPDEKGAWDESACHLERPGGWGADR